MSNSSDRDIVILDNNPEGKSIIFSVVVSDSNRNDWLIKSNILPVEYEKINAQRRIKDKVNISSVFLIFRHVQECDRIHLMSYIIHILHDCLFVLFTNVLRINYTRVLITLYSNYCHKNIFWKNKTTS